MGNSTVFLSCPSASGNYCWENLPRSEIHLVLVFATPTLLNNSSLEIGI